MPIKQYIRTIPDHPHQGIMFRDITTLFKHPDGLRMAFDQMYAHCKALKIDKVAGIEARGFILGATLAYQLGIGFIPIRKKGKLPAATFSKDYALEYGTDQIEIHTDAFAPGERVLLVDDLIATGGTAEAAATLVREAGGDIVECAFIIELPDLGGAKKLEQLGLNVFSLCSYEGE